MAHNYSVKCCQCHSPPVSLMTNIFLVPAAVSLALSSAVKKLTKCQKYWLPVSLAVSVTHCSCHILLVSRVSWVSKVLSAVIDACYQCHMLLLSVGYVQALSASCLKHKHSLQPLSQVYIVLLLWYIVKVGKDKKSNKSLVMAQCNGDICFHKNNAKRLQTCNHLFTSLPHCMQYKDSP